MIITTTENAPPPHATVHPIAPDLIYQFKEEIEESWKDVTICFINQCKGRFSPETQADPTEH